MTPTEFSNRIKRILGKLGEIYGVDFSDCFSSDEDSCVPLCMTDIGELYVSNKKMPYNTSHVTRLSYRHPDDEMDCCILISMFNDDTIFIFPNNDRLIFEFNNDYRLDGPVNRVLYDYECLVEAGNVMFISPEEERIDQFISAVEYLKAERRDELPDASPNWETPLGFVAVKAFWELVEDYRGGFEVFWDDGLMIYQSFADDGLLCEGTSLSTGVTFCELTHFENMEALQKHLHKAN